MTQSDKDFITRIQVSQLVTQDPYAEDFYAQVYGAILRSRMGMNSSDERVLKFGASGGVGLGMGQRGAGRRPNALQRMEQQVERIVNNARQRERERGMNRTSVYIYVHYCVSLAPFSCPRHSARGSWKNCGQKLQDCAAPASPSFQSFTRRRSDRQERRSGCREGCG